jgi:hypothetical protein
MAHRGCFAACQNPLFSLMNPNADKAFEADNAACRANIRFEQLECFMIHQAFCASPVSVTLRSTSDPDIGTDANRCS